MSLLSSILAKTKATVRNDFGKNKWRRRVDIEKERSNRMEEKSKKRKLDHEIDPVKRPKSSPILPSPATVPKKIIVNLSEDEVLRRLRRLKEPITFFGETNEQRLQRLRHLELMDAERTHSASDGRINEFQQLVKAEVEAEIEAALAKTMGKGIVTEDLLEKDRLKQEARRTKYDKARSKSEFEHMEDYILFYFKRINRLWEKRLNDRSEAEKLSQDGKAETARQKQARRDIKPFFKLLKNRNSTPEIVRHVTAVVDALLKREYSLAEEKYLEMSIGNAPWPMGVTQVGIHERAGRSKIFSSQIAHILNDESQRKYIQAMKRYMTFAEKLYPPYSFQELERMRIEKIHEKSRSLLNVPLVR